MISLIDMFNDNPWYLDEIFTIDNHKFEQHIPDKSQTKPPLKNENTSDKRTSFFGLDIKVIGSDVHTCNSVCDNRDDLR